MADESEGIATHVFPSFNQPARTSGLVPHERAVPPLVAPVPDRPGRPLVPSPAAGTVPDGGTGIREQAVARQLCRRLNVSGRCPGECVTSQLARGVPLRELRGLDAFEVPPDGGWSS
jgi:hypothetical protein